MEPGSTDGIATLDDITLVRMLTLDAANHDAETLAAAEAEANRRGLPIDPAFIPVDRDGDGEAGGADGVGGDEAGEDGAFLEGTRFAAKGKPIHCAHCGGETFTARSDVLLNTRGLTFFRLDWLNRGATALMCETCGAIQFFAKAPEPID